MVLTDLTFSNCIASLTYQLYHFSSPICCILSTFTSLSLSLSLSSSLSPLRSLSSLFLFLLHQARMLFEFDGDTENGELVLKEGDIVTVLNTVSTTLTILTLTVHV